MNAGAQATSRVMSVQSRVHFSQGRFIKPPFLVARTRLDGAGPRACRAGVHAEYRMLRVYYTVLGIQAALDT